MKLFNNTWKLAIAGAIVGVLAALLAFFGNPANMAICVACFIRDTAGALSLHSAAPVQYFRPEIVGNRRFRTNDPFPAWNDHDDRRFGIPWMSASYGNPYVCR